MGASKIFLEYEIAMPHNQQTAILCGTLGEIECLLQARELHTRELMNFRSLLQRTPAALTIRRRKVIASLSCCRSDQKS